MGDGPGGHGHQVQGERGGLCVRQRKLGVQLGERQNTGTGTGLLHGREPPGNGEMGGGDRNPAGGVRSQVGLPDEDPGVFSDLVTYKLF